MYTPIKRLSRLNATLQGAMAASGRIVEVLDTPLEVREAEGSRPLPRPQGEIEYRQVGFQYADGRGANVLRCVSFSARAGEVVAIVGTSGAGKTTLMNLLPRFYDVTDGAITIDGVDIPDVTPKSLPRPIRPLTQEAAVL